MVLDDDDAAASNATNLIVNQIPRMISPFRLRQRITRPDEPRGPNRTEVVMLVANHTDIIPLGIKHTVGIPSVPGVPTRRSEIPEFMEAINETTFTSYSNSSWFKKVVRMTKALAELDQVNNKSSRRLSSDSQNVPLCEIFKVTVLEKK